MEGGGMVEQMSVVSPLFSIILPVFNAARTLERTLGSLHSQLLRDFELILVDDGSTDGSSQIAESLAAADGRIRVFRKANGGVASARNEALRHVRGRYVTFCDADDCPASDWLQAFADAMADNDVVVQGWTYVIGQKEEPQTYDGVADDVASAVDEMSRRESFGFLWNKCFRADIIAEHGLRFDERFRFLEDEEFICRYWTHVRRMKFVPCAAYHYAMPDFGEKYRKIDGFLLYVSLLSNASRFIGRCPSVTLQKYTMGLFRNMMLSFQMHRYGEAWHRLGLFAGYGRAFRQHNKYMRVIRSWNWPMWYPVLAVYTCFKR